MDRIGADSGSDCDAYHPFLGMLLRDIDLEPLDAAMDVGDGGLSPWRYRDLFRNDHIWSHDDRGEHRVYGSLDRSALLFSGGSQGMKSREMTHEKSRLFRWSDRLLS